MKEPTAETSGDAKEYGSVVTIADSNGERAREPDRRQVGRRHRGATTGLRQAAALRPQGGPGPVYVVEISLDAITTKFSDWIEQDLLKLNSFDVAKLDLHDYSLLPVQDPDSGRRGLAAHPPHGHRRSTGIRRAATWDLEKMTPAISRGSQTLEANLADG